MKGRLQIDFEILPGGGKQVFIAGELRAPGGQVVDATTDVMFCFGLLDYAKALLWEKERKALEPVPGDGTVEIAPAGYNPRRANGRNT